MVRSLAAIAVLVVALPASSQTADQRVFRSALHDYRVSTVVPDHVQERLREAGADAGDTGLAIAKELVEAARDLAAGVYLIPPFRQPHAALDLFA